MTLRQTIQEAPSKTSELITKLSATSNKAVKMRESLFAALSEELGSYVEVEEQHLLPLLRKQPDLKDLAVDALKGHKDLHARLTKLRALPKDDDAFLVQLTELDKSFQQHVRNERKELLPAVLKALSDDEANTVAANLERAVAGAEKERREEKREAATEAKRQTQEAEEASAAEVRAQRTIERNAREANEKIASTTERGAASVQDGARQFSADIMKRAQKAASETREAVAVFGGSAQKVVEDLQAVRASSAISATAVSEIGSTWVDFFGKVAHANAEAAQQTLRCSSIKQMAELQREFVTTAMRNWIEGQTKVLQITQRTSKQALAPLDGRLSEAA